MRLTAVVVLVAALAACNSTEKQALDSTMAAAETAAPTLADFSGIWDLSTKLEGVENPVPSKLAGSGDNPNWMMTLEGRDNIPVHVMIVGDSLIGESDPYESVLREGVMVTFRTATALTSATTLQGSLIATYDMPSGVEKVSGVTTGTRVP
jgi:hypothetical protein